MLIAATAEASRASFRSGRCLPPGNATNRISGVASDLPSPKLPPKLPPEFADRYGFGRISADHTHDQTCELSLFYEPKWNSMVQDGFQTFEWGNRYRRLNPPRSGQPPGTSDAQSSAFSGESRALRSKLLPDRQLWLGAYSCLFPDRKLRDSLILIPRGFRAFNASRGPGKMVDPIVANAKGRCSNLASIRG
jgi:hypothetical protein